MIYKSVLCQTLKDFILQDVQGNVTALGIKKIC
ncbi:MAG: hypothetical protein HJHJAOHD_01288 [Flavobacteriales bacterium]|nr:hypothetical protein [Flavobacteriales bacterium]